MPIGHNVTGTCTRCGRTVEIDLRTIGKKGDGFQCPACDGGSKEAAPPPKKKKKKVNTRSKEFRFPENADMDPGTYPVEVFLEGFHCRTLNNYHHSPHLRSRDIGMAHRELETAGLGHVKRAHRRVRCTVISHRQKEIDWQNLAAGGAKGLVDVLVRRGWIKDDSEEWLDYKTSQKIVLQKDLDVGEKRGTFVRIELIRKKAKNQ